MYVESAAAEHDERDEAADVVEAIGHADGDLDAAVGLHPWSQRDHHFDDHGAVAVARHSRARRHRRFTHVDDVHESAYGMLADAAAPVFAPAGFDDWHASAALITGFVAKEVVVGSMSQSYHADGEDDTASQQAGEGTLGQKLRASFDQSSYGHGRAAAIAFLLFTLAYTPCLATVAEMRRQFGTKIAARSVPLSLAVATSSP